MTAVNRIEKCMKRQLPEKSVFRFGFIGYFAINFDSMFRGSLRRFVNASSVEHRWASFRVPDVYPY